MQSQGLSTGWLKPSPLVAAVRPGGGAPRRCSAPERSRRARPTHAPGLPRDEQRKAWERAPFLRRNVNQGLQTRPAPWINNPDRLDENSSS